MPDIYPTNPKDFPKTKKEMKSMIEEKHKSYIHSQPFMITISPIADWLKGRESLGEYQKRIKKEKKVIGTKPVKMKKRLNSKK